MSHLASFFLSLLVAGVASAAPTPPGVDRYTKFVFFPAQVTDLQSDALHLKSLTFYVVRDNLKALKILRAQYEVRIDQDWSPVDTELGTFEYTSQKGIEPVQAQIDVMAREFSKAVGVEAPGMVTTGFASDVTVGAFWVTNYADALRSTRTDHLIPWLTSEVAVGTPTWLFKKNPDQLGVVARVRHLTWLPQRGSEPTFAEIWVAGHAEPRPFSRDEKEQLGLRLMLLNCDEAMAN